jgi:sigma-E factor negative regulatory protein RseB
MSERSRAWLPLAAVWACLLHVAPGALAQAQAPALPSVTEAREWLSRIHDAARRGNYRGTMVLAAGGAMSSSRVWHYCVGESTYEHLESLDGRQQRIYRVNDEVHTLWPQDRLAIVERRDMLAPVPTTPQAVDPLALEHYELRREGVARVAGRDAQVFTLEPRDDLRYAQRLWADRASGLMLRADVLGPGRGASRPLLESSAFSEIEINPKPPADAQAQAVPRLEGYRVLRPQAQRTQLEAEGWAMGRPPAGFRLTGCVKRTLELPTGGSVGEPVLQATFTDGLAQVSLFIEPHSASRPRNEMQAHQGATTTLVMRRQDHWITVVGDAPAATLKLLAGALERRR